MTECKTQKSLHVSKVDCSKNSFRTQTYNKKMSFLFDRERKGGNELNGNTNTNK